MENIADRITKLGAPRGIKVLLADLAHCTANDVTAFVQGRPMCKERRIDLENALTIVEKVYSQPIRPELTADNVMRAAQEMFA